MFGLMSGLRARPVRAPESGISRRKSIWERTHLDPWLLLLLVILLTAGLGVLYSASGQRIEVVMAQASRFVVAFVIMLVLAQLPPATLMRWALLLYGAGLLMLVAVELVGDVGMGRGAGW